MKITEYCVRRPITVTMIYVAITILGVISLFTIPLEFMPSADFPEVDMDIPYPSSSPTDVQKRITQKLENALSTMPGIEKMTSRSSEAGSHMHLWFKSGSNVDYQVLDVRERIDQIRDDLPDDLDVIWIWKFDSESIPIFILGVYADEWSPDVNDTLDRVLVSDLRRVDGVANAEVWGQEEQRILVEVDRAKLDQYGLSLLQLYQTLLSNNVTLDSGQVMYRSKLYDLRIVGQARGPEEIREFPVTKDIKIGDVADVGFDYESTLVRGRINRQRAAVVMLRKESGANTVNTCVRVQKALAKLIENPKLKDLKISTNVFFDQSIEITNAVNGLRESGYQGAFLAAVVLLLFLHNIRATLIIGISIPTSILITVLIMHLVLNMSFNMISLSGMMLGIGMLVDNSIVAMEAIFTCLQNGMSRRKAAVAGVQEVGIAISVSTTTTLIVFLPLLFTSASESVVIMREFGVVLCLSISASLLVALTLVPLLASLFGVSKSVAEIKTPRWFEIMRGGFIGVLKFALERRSWAMATVVVLLLLTGIPIALIEKEFVPETAMRIVRILVRLDRTRSLEGIDALVDKVESKLWAHKQEWGVESMTAFFNRNFIELNMFLPVYETPKMTRNQVKDLAKEMLRKEANWPGVEYDFENMGFEGSPAGGLSVRVLGENPTILYEVAERMRSRLAQVPGIIEVKPIAQESEREMNIKLDSELASVYGVNPTLAAYEIAYGVRGTNAGWVQNRDRQLSVVMQLREDDRRDVQTLGNYLIRNDQGQKIRVGSFADIGPVPIPKSIQRENRRTRLQIPIEYEGRDLFKLKEKIAAALDGFAMPRGYAWTMGDQFDDVREAFTTLGIAIALAIVLVFIVMVAQFESFFLPFVIMFSMPFGLIGVYWFLYIAGHTLNVLSGAGVLLLAGVVVNNAIVLVDHVNQLRARGLDRHQSLVQATEDRLRPILLTAVTTIVGLIPMAMGASDQGRLIYSPLAVAVLGGMLTSTLLIPLLIPTIYSISDDAVARLRRWWKSVAASGYK